MKGEFQRELKEPESDVEEFKLGCVSSPGAGLREAVVREMACSLLIPDRSDFASGPHGG